VSRRVFLSGRTGYLGRALIAKLVERSRRARVLPRPGSERKIPAGAEVVWGNRYFFLGCLSRRHLRPADRRRAPGTVEGAPSVRLLK
jgi:nucleoside-diphosphate-sugar epimerase